MRTKTEEKRQAILDVAAATFGELGFERTSMSEICARLGGSKATIYNYFPSKEALFVEVMFQASEADFQNTMLALQADSQDLPAAYTARIWWLSPALRTLCLGAQDLYAVPDPLRAPPQPMSRSMLWLALAWLAAHRSTALGLANSANTCRQRSCESIRCSQCCWGPTTMPGLMNRMNEITSLAVKPWR